MTKGKADTSASAAPEESVSWFRSNLELMLDDIHLRDRVDLFFDTQDLAAVVLGMYGFLPESWPSPSTKPSVEEGSTLSSAVVDNSLGSRFLWDRFSPPDETVLVHCLAAAGWLGRIDLLPPHQAEFLGLSERQFRVGGITLHPRRLAEEFLREGLARYVPGLSIDLVALKQLTEDGLVETFGKKAGHAKEVFKILQCIKGSWRLRLDQWLGQGILDDLRHYDPGEFMEHPTFLRVKAALDKLRGRWVSMNNFSDAVAVAMLAKRTADFEAGVPGSRLALFYDHAGGLARAIKLAGVETALQYTSDASGKPRKFSVLRDWRYLYLRATFGHRGREARTEATLRELLEQTEEILRGREMVAKEAVASLGPPGSEVGKHIEHIQEFRFFQPWLKEATSDVRSIIERLDEEEVVETRLRGEVVRLRDAVEDLSSAVGQQMFSEAQEILHRRFEESVGTYRRASKLLGSIDYRISEISRGLRQLERQGHEHRNDMMLILGLFRFPFPDEAYKSIDLAIKDLVGAPRQEGQRVAGVERGAAASSRERRVEAQKQVFSALWKAESGRPLPPLERAFVLGMLWATELDREIVELQARHAYGPDEAAPAAPLDVTWPHLFPLVLAAALVRESEDKRHGVPQERSPSTEDKTRQARQIEHAYEIIKRIVDLSRSMEPRDRARLDVGIAYVYFHIFDVLWEQRLAPLVVAVGEDVAPSDLLDLAIAHSRAACEVDGLDETLRTYARNQVLYYLADGILRQAIDFDAKEEELQRAARALLASEGEHGWHYRYDDTVARYYQALGLHKHDREAWEKGLVYIERAKESCFGDPVIIGSKAIGRNGKQSEGYYRKYIDSYEDWSKTQAAAG